MPPARPDDDYDDRPRRRRRDDDGPPPEKKGGVGRILLILLLVCGGGVVLCCGGCVGLMYYLSGRQVEILDATRTKHGDGGTTAVTINVRVNGDSPGGFVRGDYYFMFKSGARTSVHNMGLIGQGGAELKRMFFTPELVDQPGPVEFWVERRDRESVFRVSPVRTIP